MFEALLCRSGGLALDGVLVEGLAALAARKEGVGARMEAVREAREDTEGVLVRAIAGDTESTEAVDFRGLEKTCAPWSPSEICPRSEFSSTGT